MENLKKELIQLQKNCIGLFQYDSSSGLYMVIEEENYFIKIVSVGMLGGLNENLIDLRGSNFTKSEYKKFHNGKNLYEFIKEGHYKIKEFLDSFKNSDQNQIQILDSIENLEL